MPPADAGRAGRARQLAALLMRSAHRLEDSDLAKIGTGLISVDLHEQPGADLADLDQVREWIDDLWGAVHSTDADRKWKLINVVETRATNKDHPCAGDHRLLAKSALASVAMYDPEVAARLSATSMERAIAACSSSGERHEKGHGKWQVLEELLKEAGLKEEFAKNVLPIEGSKSSLSAGYRLWKSKRKVKPT
jgi:hypothetical protein